MSDGTKFCCEAFAEEAGQLQAPSALAFGYPSSMRPESQFERDADGTWNVNGCCGGGCFVITNMRFCPFCGTGLVRPNA